MNIDIGKLQETVNLVERLQAATKDLNQLVQTLETLNQQTLLYTSAEKFVRAGEAATILGVSKLVIDRCARAGLIKSYYVNSEQRRFKLSDVYALAKDSPWSIEEAGDAQKTKSEV